MYTVPQHWGPSHWDQEHLIQPQHGGASQGCVQQVWESFSTFWGLPQRLQWDGYGWDHQSTWYVYIHNASKTYFAIISSFVDLDIKRFMSYYRTSFPRADYPTASVLPKMHLLESHMVDWLRKYHLGTGLMGEQGAEVSTPTLIGLKPLMVPCQTNWIDSSSYSKCIQWKWTPTFRHSSLRSKQEKEKELNSLATM